MIESTKLLTQDPDLEILKVPPHSQEAEQSVLGGLMLDNDAWDRVAEVAAEVDFYRSDHRLIFRVMQKLAGHSQPLDVITLSEELSRLDKLEHAGGLVYLTELAKNTPSASNITAYASIVRERALLRQLITVADKISDSAFHTGGRSSTEILDEAERMVFQIADVRTQESEPQLITPILSKTMDRIDELSKSKSDLTGLTTNFKDLDKKTSGLQSSDLIIIAGRPSMGKTAFAMNIVENAAVMGQAPVLVFSMEMPAEQLMMRMLSSLGRIDQTRVRTGKLEQEDWTNLNGAFNLLHDKPLFIDDTPALSPASIRSRARRIVREHGKLGLIMIDYLQLMQIQGHNDGRTAEISEISRSLKALAKEMQCPILALSQLNRSLENRPNKRPVNSDLRESGAIEQDADVIMFIYRDEVYNEDSPDRGKAEIIIGKQRNGPIGTINLAFIGKYTRFEDLLHHYEDYRRPD